MRLELGENAKVYVEEKYSKDKVLNKLINQLNNLCCEK